MASSAMPALLASIGASPAVLGLIEGLSNGISSDAKLASGQYSDRLRRRKPLAVLGYFMTASGMASFAIATQSWRILLGRTLGWLGRGVRTRFTRGGGQGSGQLTLPASKGVSRSVKKLR